MHKSFFLLLFVFVLTDSLAQTKFYATVSAKKIGKEEYLQLKLIVQNANTINKVSNPMLANFSIESGPNEETSSVKINGKLCKQITSLYLLKPKAVGSFTIPSVTAILDGKEYKSEKIDIVVADKASLNTNKKITNVADYIINEGEVPENKIKGNLFIKCFLSKKHYYVGEPIEVIYKLYTRLKSESEIIKRPSFSGFSVIDEDQDQDALNNYSIEKLNGKDYNVNVLRKVQLFPLQAGAFSIDEIEVENDITFVKENYAKDKQQNFLDDFGISQLPIEAVTKYSVAVKNEVQNIAVKPLPQTNVPKYFKGAVGNFKIDAKFDTSTIAANESGKLIITISGEGNLHLINTPEIKWPQNFEVFEHLTVEDFSTNTMPLSGKKIFTYPFTVSQAGTYIIDSILFSYFNVELNLYKSLFTKPIKLNVIAGTTQKVINIEEREGDKGILVGLTKNRKWIIVLLAALVISGVAVWLIKEKRIEKEKLLRKALLAEQKQVSEVVQQKDWLSKSKIIMQSKEIDEILFYKTINKEFKDFFIEKFELDKAFVNNRTIVSALQQKGYDNAIINKAATLLYNLENKLYNPFAEKESTASIYEEVEEIISQLS